MKGRPRLVMLGIVCVSALTGFLASAVLLHLGLADIPVRYALAVTASYAALVVQLRLWVAHQGQNLVPMPGGSWPEWRPEARLRRQLARAPASRDEADARRRRIPDLDVLDVSSLGDGPAPWSGGGGMSGGGGATGSFDAVGPTHAGGSGLSGLGDVVSDVADADSWPVLAVFAIAAMLACMLGSSVYLVWAAPDLLADLAFESVLAVVLYRRLGRGAPPRGAWTRALAATWVPALLVFVLFVACGLALEHAVPGADSIREVMHALRVSWAS